MFSKWTLISIYFLILAAPLVTWARGADLSGDWRPELVRLAGLLGFTLIFLQLAIGALMTKLRPVFGNKLILRWHIVQGIIGFILANVHPLAIASLYGFSRVVKMGGYAMWGKTALILLWVSVAAGLLRASPWLQKYWRWIHRLNYGIFGLVYWHSWNMGHDTRQAPMVYIYWLAPIVFLVSLVIKLQPFWQTLVKNKSVS